MKTIFLLITFNIVSFGFAQRVDDFRITMPNDSVFYSNTIEEAYVVLFFISKDCPFDKSYSERIKTLNSSFPQHRFITIGNTQLINIDNLPSNKSLQYEFNIEKTPTAVIIKNLTNGFNVIYKGPIDDNAQLPKKVKQHYLYNVLKNPVPQKKKLYIPGCTIH